ncbi:HAD family hydrolase [Intrasporangium calvum]|uniref:HAD family hydrolase n=1 Tax=Intrasporangium calvum TaxID=53358 RepID=UPI0002E168B1|nr:HAD hydrolase-like protein [Intrasporangium calvum]AXG12655.1 HAD family hydrolase [Intrasporangium calvum]
MSNNSADAVLEFFAAHGWAHYVDGYAWRTLQNVHDLKPSPRLIIDAGRAVNRPPDSLVLVGDSVTDVQAATAAGLPTIGIAKNYQRAAALTDAGAAVVVIPSTRC